MYRGPYVIFLYVERSSFNTYQGRVDRATSIPAENRASKTILLCLLETSDTQKFRSICWTWRHKRSFMALWQVPSSWFNSSHDPAPMDWWRFGIPNANEARKSNLVCSWVSMFVRCYRCGRMCGGAFGYPILTKHGRVIWFVVGDGDFTFFVKSRK